MNPHSFCIPGTPTKQARIKPRGSSGHSRPNNANRALKDVLELTAHGLAPK